MKIEFEVEIRQVTYTDEGQVRRLVFDGTFNQDETITVEFALLLGAEEPE